MLQGRYFTVQHGFSIAISGTLVVADPMVETVLVIISSIDIGCNRISSDDFCVTILVTGTTGEGLSLTVTERRQLLEYTYLRLWNTVYTTCKRGEDPVNPIY